MTRATPEPEPYEDFEPGVRRDAFIFAEFLDERFGQDAIRHSWERIDDVVLIAPVRALVRGRATAAQMVVGDPERAELLLDVTVVVVRDHVSDLGRAVGEPRGDAVAGGVVRHEDVGSWRSVLRDRRRPRSACPARPAATIGPRGLRRWA